MRICSWKMTNKVLTCDQLLIKAGVVRQYELINYSAIVQPKMNSSVSQMSSTRNHSLSTKMTGNPGIDYDLIDQIDAEVDPERLQAFKAEIINQGPNSLKGKTQTTIDNHTRTMLYTSPSRTKVANCRLC